MQIKKYKTKTPFLVGQNIFIYKVKLIILLYTLKIKI